MPKDTFDVFKNLQIDRDVCDMLGVTGDQIRGMDLREFAQLVFAKGYTVEVNSDYASDGEEGKLSITTTRRATSDAVG